MESYVLNRLNVETSLSENHRPQFQGDVCTDKLLVETPYGFGVVMESENQFNLVRISLLPPSCGTVSIPWERIRVLPERPKSLFPSENQRSSKRSSNDETESRTNQRLRYISN